MSYASSGEDRMIGTFAKQFAPMFIQVANQRAPLHAVTVMASRITLASGCFPDQFTVPLENRFDRLLQVSPGFLDRAPLGIGARELFDKADVAFRDLTKYCRKSNLYKRIIRRNHEAQHGLRPMAVGVIMSRCG